MKLLLVSPTEQDMYMKHSAKEARSFWFARLSLTMVAALTPPDVEISIVDENLENINFEDNTDLVGITVMTAHAPRAYEIAAQFRARGVKVILGGIHPSAMPEEAIQHADTVVIGEAEGVWASLIEDFKRGRMKTFYKASKPSDLVGLPNPRRDLLKKGAYNIGSTVQTTRGCPFSCEFCSVTEFFGRGYRQRPVDEVIREIEGIDGNFIAFVDDNMIGNPKYAKELFRRLAPLKFQWGSQASITMARDPELMKLAKESGCVGMYVGMESLSSESLAGVGKTFNNVEKYEEAIKKFHDHGIMVIASIIFGFDSDNEGIFEKTVRFLEKNKIEVATFYILTPLPGTVWTKKLISENRIISYDWSKYNGAHVLFKPRMMSPETLSEGYRWAYHQFYSIPSVARRLFRIHDRIPQKLLLNWGFRRMAKKLPGGELSPFSEILNKLQKTIPTLPKEDLIPHTIKVVKDKAHETVEKIDYFLKIKVKKSEKFQAILIDLYGVLDKITAKRLRKKILLAFKKGKMDIVLNFKNVSHITPQALRVLFHKRIRRVQRYGIKLRLWNLNSSTENLLKDFGLESCYVRYIEPPRSS